MKKLEINIPEGYEIDLEKTNLKKGIIEFKSIKDEFNKLVEDKLKGYVIHTLKNKSIQFSASMQASGGVFPTREQADSALALSNLQQLMQLPQYNGDWVPDWSIYTMKYSIERYKNNCIRSIRSYNHYFLSFKTEEIRDLFYKNHEALIKQYFMIK